MRIRRPARNEFLPSEARLCVHACNACSLPPRLKHFSPALQSVSQSQSPSQAPQGWAVVQPESPRFMSAGAAVDPQVGTILVQNQMECRLVSVRTQVVCVFPNMHELGVKHAWVSNTTGLLDSRVFIHSAFGAFIHRVGCVTSSMSISVAIGRTRASTCTKHTQQARHGTARGWTTRQEETTASSRKAAGAEVEIGGRAAAICTRQTMRQ